MRSGVEILLHIGTLRRFHGTKDSRARSTPFLAIFGDKRRNSWRWGEGGAGKCYFACNLSRSFLCMDERQRNSKGRVVREAFVQVPASACGVAGNFPRSE